MIEAAAVLGERVHEHARERRTRSQLGEPPGSERLWLERTGVRVRGGDHGGSRPDRVCDGTHECDSAH